MTDRNLFDEAADQVQLHVCITELGTWPAKATITLQGPNCSVMVNNLGRPLVAAVLRRIAAQLERESKRKGGH